MPNIFIDPKSVVTTQISMCFKDQQISTGTAFFYEQNEQLYLITNWHNLTGRHPIDGTPLSPRGALPDRLRVWFCVKGKLGSWSQKQLLLYKDAETEEQPQEPLWLEHPQYKQSVDVVALPIERPDDADIHTINALDETPNMRFGVGHEVFVLGYPKGIVAGGVFPIWKNATVASEPDINLDDLPKFLIDTATREGMSGSPVFAISRGGYVSTEGSNVLGANGSRFVGVYSGRLGANEMEAQLGLVWKPTLVDEIITSQKLGTSSFS